MKILIVDDDEIIVEAICQLIRRSGIDLVIAGTAYNAKDAIRIAQREAPDMILTDIYMPEMNGIDLMREIHNQGMRAKFIVLSAYRDFAYAQQSLKFGASEYILKPVSEQTLADTLTRVMTIIVDENKEKDLKRELVKDRLYYALTSDKMREKNESALNSLLPSDGEEGCFRVAVFEFNEIDSEVNLYDKDNVMEVVQIIQSIFCDPSPNIVFDHDPHHIVVLMKAYQSQCGNDAGNILIGHAIKAKNELMAKLGLKTNIGISNPVKARSDLPSAYKKAVYATRNKFYMGMETVTVFDGRKEMDTDLTNLMSTISKKVVELAEQINLLASEKARGALDEIFEMFSENSSLHPDSIYTACFEIVLVLKYETSKLMPDWQTHQRLFKLTIDDIRKYGTMKEIHHFLVKLVANCIASLSQEQQEGGSAVISKAIKFCKNNLSSDITLEIMAEHLNMNKSYFSFLFKKEMGENFWKYLTQLKLEKAKELLTETNLKSYEIAEMVGYKNASHFGKVFKEHEGLTPSEYKEKHIY
ncbi:response regulator [Cohnella zeiphila]|uniref:Response regulator n=1 Tax=Cohnella zeiphila TaxID=2761120 RepID=A0A7X0VXI4_9BACL|nr:response regulator [Cohnella zeiphila]MBB6731948.1 response regulator [Cohnella zeiphila]